MSAEIRRASESDIPGILALYAQPGIDDGAILSAEDATAIFRRMAEYPDYRVYVAAEQDAIIGTFALLIMDNLAHLGAPSAVVEDVVVDEAHRGQGVGTAMMRFAMEAASESGCYKLTLSSDLKRGDAHAFYRSIGFERHGLSFRVGLSERESTASDRGSPERSLW